jgi:hypothetical protein
MHLHLPGREPGSRSAPPRSPFQTPTVGFIQLRPAGDGPVQHGPTRYTTAQPVVLGAGQAAQWKERPHFTHGQPSSTITIRVPLVRGRRDLTSRIVRQNSCQSELHLT